jgi:hypothetical protein
MYGDSNSVAEASVGMRHWVGSLGKQVSFSTTRERDEPFLIGDTSRTVLHLSSHRSYLAEAVEHGADHGGVDDHLGLQHVRQRPVEQLRHPRLRQAV